MIESNKKKRNDHIRNDPTTLTLSITSVVCCVVQYLLWECVCVCVCVESLCVFESAYASEKRGVLTNRNEESLLL